MELNLELWVSDGQATYGLSALAESVTFTSTRNIEASRLEFSVVGDDRVHLWVGNTVDFTADGKGIFKGVINRLSRDETGLTKVEAVDALWYAKAKGVYQFDRMEASQVIAKLAQEVGIPIGRLTNTGYVQDWLYPEEKSIQDIACDVLNRTIRATGRVWCLYMDYGALSLTEPTALASAVVIGDRSLAYKYTYDVDIKESYNQIKLVRPNDKTGRADVYLFENSTYQDEWGLLRLYQKVDENMTEAQIIALGEQMLDYYCAEKRELKISALGVPGIRAGSLVHIKIDAIELSRKLLIEKAVHKYKNCDHTMELRARVV